MKIVAQVPFSGQTATVPGPGQHFWQGRELPDDIVGARTDLRRIGNVNMNSVLGRDQAGEECGAARRANRIIAVGARKQHSLGGEAINVRRPDFLVAVTTECPRAVIIGQNENQVQGRRRLRTDCEQEENPDEDKRFRFQS